MENQWINKKKRKQRKWDQENLLGIDNPHKSYTGRKEDLVAERDYIGNDKPQAPGGSTGDTSKNIGTPGKDYPATWGEASNE
jgi:hypothetical protein